MAERDRLLSDCRALNSTESSNLSLPACTQENSHSLLTLIFPDRSMILNNLLAIFDNELRANLNLPGVILENTGQIVRDYSLEDGSGYIDYSSLDEDNANEESEHGDPRS